MKFGLFSDIHANLEAFEAVVAEFEKEQIDQYIFLGDLVGYGASPAECLQLFQAFIVKHPCKYVAGNHDHAVCDLTPYFNFVQYAKESVEWTKKQLSAAEIDFLKRMPMVERVNGITAVHANLHSPHTWDYILDIDDAYQNFKVLSDPVCFIGHSHKPIVFSASEHIDWSMENTLSLKPGMQYIINIGSVGQPRDGNPKAAYALYDSERQVAEIRRISYDIENAQRKILEAGLPAICAERLSIGK